MPRVVCAFGELTDEGFGIPQHSLELYRALTASGAQGWSFSWEEFGRAPLPAQGLRDQVDYRRHSIPRRLFRRPLILPDVLTRRIRPTVDVYHQMGIGLDPPVDGDRLVVSLHDLIGLRYPETSDGFPPWAGALLDRAAAITTPSRFSRDEIVGVFPSTAGKVWVTDNGVDLDTFYPAASLPAGLGSQVGTRPFLLIVGGATERKNVERALAAAGQAAADSGVNARIVIAGGRVSAAAGDALSELKAICDVVDVGYVTREELAGLYAHASALIFASLYEGYGLPIVEALAAGCPVVTSDRGAMAEVGGTAATLVDPTDVDAIADAAATYLEQGRGTPDEVADRRSQAAEHTWERCARLHLDVYNRVLDT